MKARQPVQVDLSRDDVHRLVQALAGLTLHQTRRVIAQAILEDGKLSPVDIERVVRWKGEIIERGGILEFFPAEDNPFELGGFARLKAWLDARPRRLHPRGERVNLQPPKGVLLVGVQGCGKSLAAKSIARRVAAAAAQARRRAALRQVRRRVREELPPRHRDWPSRWRRSCSGSTRSRRPSPPARRPTPTAASRQRALRHASSPGCRRSKDGVFVVGDRQRHRRRCRPSCCARAASTRSSSSTCPTRDERARDLRASTCACASRTRRRSTSPRSPTRREGFSGAEIEQAVIAALYRALHEKQPLATERVHRSAARDRAAVGRRAREDVERLRAFARGRFTPVA